MTVDIHIDVEITMIIKPTVSRIKNNFYCTASRATALLFRSISSTMGNTMAQHMGRAIHLAWG